MNMRLDSIKRIIIFLVFMMVSFSLICIPHINAGEILNEVYPSSDLLLQNVGSQTILTYNVTFLHSYQSSVIILLNYSDLYYNYLGFTAEMNGINITSQFDSYILPSDLMLQCDSIIPTNGTLSIELVFSPHSEGNTTFFWRCIYLAYQQPPFMPSILDLEGHTNVHVREFQVSNLVVTPTEVGPGEEVDVSFTVLNVGSQAGTYNVAVKIDGAIIEQKNVTLEGGASTSLNFTVSSNEEGSHTIVVEDLVEYFTVTSPSQPPAPPPPFIPPMVENEKPIARAGADQTTFVNQVLTFDGSKSIDPDGNLSTYFWTFGDGSIAYGDVVSHAYSSVGSYAVILVVIDDLGATNSDNLSVTVTELPMTPNNLMNEFIEANQTNYEIDALEVANTTLTLNSTDQVTVLVLTYPSNPHPEVPLPPNTLSTVVDIAVSNLEAIEWPIHVERHYSDREIFGLNESKLILYYYKDGAWHKCYDTGVYPEKNIVWANMNKNEMTGSPIIIGQLPIPATFEVTDLIVDPTLVEAGENVTVTIKVINKGDFPGNYTIYLKLDGIIEKTLTILLNEQSFSIESFIITSESSGTHFIEINNLKVNFTAIIPPTPPKLEVSNISIKPSLVKSGETVTASVNVANIGTNPGNITLRLQVNGIIEQNHTLTLTGETNTTVIFNVTKNALGTYLIDINGLYENFIVEGPPAPANIVVTHLDLHPKDAEPGEKINITITVVNEGEKPGNKTIEVKIDGHVSESRFVNLEGGSTLSFNITVSEEEGTHELEVANLTVSFNVLMPDNKENDTFYTIENLFLIGALLVIIIFLYLKYFKSKKA